MRIRIERFEIQKRDRMFKEHNRLRFKTSQHHSSCKKLLVDGEHITNPADIAGHFRSFYSSLASSNTTSPNPLSVASTIAQLEDKSFGCNDHVIDTEIGIEEIEGALKLLKPNRSGGVDRLRAEHFKYGGKHLKLWLMKIFNRFLILEDVPQCMKDGLVIPVHKGQGKTPLQVNSYRGITLSVFYPRSLR